MVMMEITEDKFDKMYEHVEKALKSMGKVMQCFEELQEEAGSMGQRGGYGNRGHYGNRGNSGASYGGYGNRVVHSMNEWEEDDWEDDSMDERGYGNRMGQRRGMRGGRR